MVAGVSDNRLLSYGLFCLGSCKQEKHINTEDSDMKDEFPQFTDAFLNV